MIGGNANGMDCLQFMLAPTKLDGSDARPDLAPHVISNSWRARVDYTEIIHTLYLAGIMFIKAGENEGTDCGTIHPPGHLAEVTAVGAFQQGDTITSFSSRGPMLLDGQTIIKPNLAAPGMDCPTTTNGGRYGTSVGTSAACPHVAGAVALILSARPDLVGRVDTLQMILQQTAEPKYDHQCPPDGPGGVPNNVWGYGILNARDAVLLAQGLGMGDIQGLVSDNGSGQPITAAKITFEDTAGRQLLGTDVISGSYGHTLPADSYTVSVTTYGYYPGVVGGVPVFSGGLTVQDISLMARPVHLVSGTIVAPGSGNPLAATVTVLHTPIPPVQSDPITGYYSIAVAEGLHTLRVEALQHLSEERHVVVDLDQTQDFNLDPVPYVPHEDNPVLEPGAPDAWDGRIVAGPSVVYADGVFYLFYVADNPPSSIGAIGYATSTDGVNFTKYAGNPVLAGDGSGFDADWTGYPAVLEEDGNWTLYYAGWASGGEIRIGRATAPAPSGPWTRRYNPVLSPGGYWQWDGERIYPDSVVATGAGYMMFYTGDSIPGVSTRIGLATSPDGTLWTKYDDPATPSSPFAESDPVLRPGSPDTWDYRMISHSVVRRTPGGWEMFYSGWDPLLITLAIGRATSPDGIHWTKDTHNPILQPKDDPLATTYVESPTVVQVGPIDWMYYDYGDGDIGVATRESFNPVSRPRSFR